MKKKLIIPILLCASTVLAQESNIDLTKYEQEVASLQQKINAQERLIKQQNAELVNLNNTLKSQQFILDSVRLASAQHTQHIQRIASDLGTKIDQTELSTKDSISKLDVDVSKNRTYWLLGTLATLALGGAIYWMLGKRIQSSKIDVESQIKNTKKSLEEEAVKLDSKLVEVLETQLKIQQEQKVATKVEVTNEVDHSLVLKVADEVTRIQKNLNQMSSDIKGYKQLLKSVTNIKANFASNGYELVDMLGKEYNEGMKVVPSFIPSEEIETGKQIITRIIKPQVNFKNEMIQAAQIEVSVGE